MQRKVNVEAYWALVLSTRDNYLRMANKLAGMPGKVSRDTWRELDYLKRQLKSHADEAARVTDENSEERAHVERV